jgi:trehalose 6-phosphate synthase
MLTPPSSPQHSRNLEQLGSERKLIVVSNRLPITIERHAGGRYQYNKSSGGLVTGMSGLNQGTNFEWYGWPGLSLSAPAEELLEVERVLKEEHNAVPVSLDNRLADTHYNGFSSMTFNT